MNALLIEHASPARSWLETQIQAFGFDVTVCADGATGVAAFQQAFYPLLILNLNLSDMPGGECCRQIRALPGSSQSIILVLTERHDPEYLQAVIALGANDYLIEPVNPDLLKMRLAFIKRLVQKLAQQPARIA